MRTYRVADELEVAALDSAQADDEKVPDMWKQYIADYEADIMGEDTSFTEQTIDEEYTAYILSLPKRAGTLDTIKFWEVSVFISQLSLP
jgi:hypothetical protein